MSELETTAGEVTQEVPAKKLDVSLRESLRRIREKIETFSKEAKIEELLEQIKEELETLVKDAENSTREHPLEAIGTCFLAGLVIGILVGTMIGKRDDR